MLSIEQINKLQEENKLLKDTIKNKNLVGIVEENERLKNAKELVCEKYEIKPDVLSANIKMFQQQKKARDASIRVKEFIKMSKEFAKKY